MGSFALSEQKDQRVVAEQAQLVVAPEAQYSAPGSIALSADAWSSVSLSDVVFNEFPETLQKSIGDILQTVSETNVLTSETSRIVQTETLPSLVDSFNQAVSKAAQTSQQVTETLGDKLSETQLGVDALLPGVAKYLIVSVVVILLGRMIIK